MSHIGGTLNMFGSHPGSAWDFDGPAFPKQVCYFVKFTSTYEAIEKLILPPPLKVDRSLPPEVITWYFSSPESRGPGGQLVPYQGIQFRGYTEVNGVKGVAGWEFIDGLRGDKTEAAIMGPWGVQFGMMKKFANIHFTPISGDQFEIVAKRLDKTVFKMVIGMGAEMKGAERDRLFEGKENPMTFPTFSVREIPNADWSGYVDRCILKFAVNEPTINRAWRAVRGSIEFGNAESDPLDELCPQNVQAMMIGHLQTPREAFKSMEEIANFT
ncbi:hypothetical protein BS50DRAFT_638580 [Corynespora cassiicola Philippines]|uniref:Acetoacetate decarboxylase n=1 Tax=Corynespora cassiicola Philippines TaxID=1448308 RepID=A0A2T2N9E3_CORCC|nr:hypothetical protein BS50DRAFT_638580 [Corynespora cassiicola Philippines]